MSNYSAGLERKENIVNQAKRMFYDHGFIDVTMKEVCLSLNISQSLIFHYFKDKTDLATTIYDWANDLLVDEIFLVLRKTYSDKSALVKELVHNGMIMKSIMDDAHLYRFYAEMAQVNPLFMRSVKNIQRNMRFNKRFKINKSSAELEMDNIYAASSAHLMLNMYLNNKMKISQRRFIEYLIKTPMILSDSTFESQEAVDEALEIIFSHPIDFGKLFLSPYKIEPIEQLY